MAPWGWAIAIAAFLILEFVTYDLVSIWFAAGCVGGLILSLIPGVGFWWQLLASIALSLLLLAFTRRLVKKWMETKQSATNVDALVGKQFVLLTDITATAPGTVKINGVTWNVTAKQPVAAGESVTVLEVSGSKLLAEKTDKN